MLQVRRRLRSIRVVQHRNQVIQRVYGHAIRFQLRPHAQFLMYMSVFQHHPTTKGGGQFERPFTISCRVVPSRRSSFQVHFLDSTSCDLTQRPNRLKNRPLHRHTNLRRHSHGTGPLHINRPFHILPCMFNCNVLHQAPPRRAPFPCTRHSKSRLTREHPLRRSTRNFGPQNQGPSGAIQYTRVTFGHVRSLLLIQRERVCSWLRPAPCNKVSR